LPHWPGFGLYRKKPETTETHHLKNDANHQRAAGADGDFFAVAQVCNADFKAIAAWAREMVDLQGRVEGHVLDFDLVVDGHRGRVVSENLAKAG
jgi:hypothetical protein